MKESKIILSLAVFILLFGNLFSFDLEDHLYLTEDSAKISEEKFIANGIEYTLVKYENNEIFLLSGEELIENQKQISEIIGIYYKQKYYPSDSEVETLSELIEVFKASRDSDSYSSYEMTKDQLCLANLFMLTLKNGEIVELFPCYDQESCDYTELMFCSAIGEKPFSMCRPGELIEDFKHISYASRSLTSIMNNISEKFNEDTSDLELYNALKYIYENSDAIKKNSQDIGNSLFKTPTNITESCNYITMGLPDYNCFRLCGNLDYNITAIDMIKASSKTLVEKMEPYAKKDEISLKIYNETNKRIEYKENVKLANIYLDEFEPLYLQGTELEFKVNDTLENKVYDTGLKTRYNELILLRKDINDSIISFNFTDIDKKMENYILLMNKTETQLDEALEIYNLVEDEKSKVEANLLYLELKSLDSNLEGNLEEIKNTKEELDENLSKTTSIKTISQIENQYEEMMINLNKTVESQKDNVLFLQLKTFARKVNTNVNNLLIEIQHPTYDQKMYYSQNIPLYLSIINFVSITCVGLFIFLVLISRMNFTRISQILAYLAIVALFVIFAGAFSYGFYNYLDRTTNMADLDEFSLAMHKHNETAIVLNLNGVPQENIIQMQTCAQKLSEIYANTNETIEIYELNSGCYKNGEMLSGITSSKCIEQIDNPIIDFEYSSVYKKPTVQSIFIDKLTLYGDNKFYKDCNIESIFRVIEFGE